MAPWLTASLIHAPHPRPPPIEGADLRAALLLDGTERPTTTEAVMCEIYLRAEITIDGTTYTYEEPYPRALWEANPDERSYVENVVRENLGKSAMMKLKPPVTVHASPRLDETAGQQAGTQ
jgi:hypothetical protein